MKKYELLTNDVMVINDKNVEHKVYRIRALRDFHNIKQGELGGYVESESNLSHYDYCWVGDNSMVLAKAKVIDHAQLWENAIVMDKAMVCEVAKVSGNARVSGEAQVKGHARVFENADVSGEAFITENAAVHGYGKVTDGAMLRQHSVVLGNACVRGYAGLWGNTIVMDSADVSDRAFIQDTRVDGTAIISGDAMIKSLNDYVNIGGFTNEFRRTTFFRLRSGGIGVCSEEFYGTLADFRNKVVETYGFKKCAKEYFMLTGLVEFHFDKDKK